MDLPATVKNRSLRLTAEILHQLIGRLFYYLRGSMHPRWCRISSINSSKCASCISMASPICHRPPHEADKGLGGSGLGPKNQLQVGPITYWDYNPSYPNIRQFTGVITPFTTSRGPSCITIKTKHSGEISFSLAQWLAVPITILQEINQEAIF